YAITVCYFDADEQARAKDKYLTGSGDQRMKDKEAVVEDEAMEEEEWATSRTMVKEMTDVTRVERKDTSQDTIRHGRRGAITGKQTDGQSRWLIAQEPTRPDYVQMSEILKQSEQKGVEVMKLENLHRTTNVSVGPDHEYEKEWFGKELSGEVQSPGVAADSAQSRETMEAETGSAGGLGMDPGRNFCIDRRTALIAAQKDDASLATCFGASTHNSSTPMDYVILNGVLMTKWSPSNASGEWEEVQQIVIPKPYRTYGLSLAQAHPFSGHLGHVRVKNTTVGIECILTRKSRSTGVIPSDVQEYAPLLLFGSRYHQDPNLA
ncbi:hypothetical protein P4O66_013376, partial [Electrophorus voltai]